MSGWPLLVLMLTLPKDKWIFWLKREWLAVTCCDTDHDNEANGVEKGWNTDARRWTVCFYIKQRQQPQRGRRSRLQHSGTMKKEDGLGFTRNMH